ncbi:MAG: 50S ribosomal protein L2 [Patescibacteria group bacterium]
MGVRIHKPTSPGRRKSSVDDFADITVGEPLKSLTVIAKSKAGRNFQGKITARHRGGGHRKFYRVIDFIQDKFNIPATVATIEYDPNRNARIALLYYRDGAKRYILAPDGLKVGEVILSSKEKIEMKVGNRMPVQFIPVGMLVSNVELTPGRGGELARAAGMSVAVMGVDEGKATLKLPSGEMRSVPKMAMVTVGSMSNPDARNVRYGKAGRMRYRGIRPTVRGKAMNPVDHPHGGGEGNQPIGLKHPKIPWGKPALGYRTRQKKKKSNIWIIRRRTVQSS